MRAYVQRNMFDAVGNPARVQHDAVGGSWTREYTYADDGNRLLSTQAPGDPAGVALTYDVAGNMTSMPHLTAMVWDHGERLREVDLGVGGTAYYVYDGGGQRVRKVVENRSSLDCVDEGRIERVVKMEFEVVNPKDRAPARK